MSNYYYLLILFIVVNGALASHRAPQKPYKYGSISMPQTLSDTNKKRAAQIVAVHLPGKNDPKLIEALARKLQDQKN
jgi:hypothetical protein